MNKGGPTFLDSSNRRRSTLSLTCSRYWELLAGSVVCVLLLTGGCQPDTKTGTAEHVRVAAELESAGRFDEAIAELQTAIALNPKDPGLRQIRATLFLVMGNGELATVELNKAIALGTPRASLLPELAEALLLQKRPIEALDLTPAADQLPADAAPEWRLRMASVRARSLLATRNAAETDVQTALLEMFSLMEETARLDGPPGLRLATEVKRFQQLRRTATAVERAWQHHACRSATLVRYTAEGADGPPARAQARPATGSESRVLQVGPGRHYATLAAAAREAQHGDTVEIDAGTYHGGNALWAQDRLTIRGVGGRARITAGARGTEDRDVWLLTGNQVRIENVEISGAKARSSRNGAAIRHMGRDLVLRNVYLHNNENGVLIGDREPESDVLIEHSEFVNNGFGDGLSHNMYVGRVGSFTIRFSWSHGARSGHLIKSRARRNLILANRLTDDESGRSSYLIDLSEGGDAIIAGNLLQKSYAGENPSFISFATESTPLPGNSLTVVNNTFWNGRFKAIAVRNRSKAQAIIANNIFAGAPVLALDGPGSLLTNLRRAETGLRDPRGFDFSLMPGSAAIDRGTDLASVDPRLTTPLLEYVHPLEGRQRIKVWAPDLGAYEFCGG